MNWLNATATFLYYLIYPFVVLLSWLLVILTILAAPLIHLGHYLLHASLLPFRILVKFETLYIFFGVAALVGIVAGLILHLSSNFIIQLLHLDKIQEEEQTEGYTAATYRAARQKKKQEEKLQKAAQRRLLATHPAVVDGASLKREYADWLEQDHGRRKDGLLSTTILEEEDDSETGF